MSHDRNYRHYLADTLNRRAIRVMLVGCGGNGGQMLMGLASLDTALRTISSRSLDVTLVDDDVVTEANLGRQPFYRCDVGNSKAHTLTERINLAHGLVGRRSMAAHRSRSGSIMSIFSSAASTLRRPGASLARPLAGGRRLPLIGWTSATARPTDNSSSVALRG